MAGWIILGILVLFLAVLVVRTLLFQPKAEPEKIACDITVNREKVTEDLSAMIQCRTVSYQDESLIDEAEFEKFRMLLKERFPLVHEACSLQKLGKNGLLYCLKGENGEEPGVLMAHYDVVPADEKGFEKPPFAGLIEDGCIWGRGTLDTKGTLCGIMEALEQLLSEDYRPRQDLYLSFSGEEEVEGKSCPAIVSYMQQQGIRPAFVLDEGGAVVEHVFPGVTRPCAVIGIGEKVGMNVELTLEGKGGHSSTPPEHTLAGQMAKAIVRLEKHPFRPQFTKPVKEMFDTLGREASFGIRLVFANLWCFLPLVNFFSKKAGGELNAMMRSTCAVTRMEGSKAFNVLPPKVTAGLNLRLLGNDTAESAVQHIRRVIKNDQIQVSVQHAMEPSGYSDTDNEKWEKLCSAVHTIWPDAVVTPYLMMACSDSRHYSRITDRIYKFSAMALSKEERGMIHGNNERVPIETMIRTVEFYQCLMRVL